MLIIVGVGVGILVIVVMSALLSGLQSNLVKRTLSSQSHIVLLPPEEIARPLDGSKSGPLIQRKAQRLRSIDQWQNIYGRLEKMPEIAAVLPVAAGPAFTVRGDANKSVSLIGIEPENYNRIIGLEEQIVAGRLRLNAGEVVIGIELVDGSIVSDRGI